jgi:peptide/nickel transport system substrate-binding protein
MVREHWKKIGIDLIVQETERSLANKKAAGNETQLYAWNNDGSEHMFTFPTHIFPFDGTSSGGALHGRWFQTSGREGAEPDPKMKELMEKWRKAFGVPEAERIQLGKDVWKIAAEEVYIISIIGLGAASQGVRITKNNFGNTPSRMYNSPDGRTPGIARPVTFYFKS